MKTLIVCILLSQLLIINYFVSSDELLWGFNIISNLSKGIDWRVNGFFPRVILILILKC